MTVLKMLTNTRKRVTRRAWQVKSSIGMISSPDRLDEKRFWGKVCMSLSVNKVLKFVFAVADFKGFAKV